MNKIYTYFWVAESRASGWVTSGLIQAETINKAWKLIIKHLNDYTFVITKIERKEEVL
jgi:hypothetical protein